MRPRRGVCSSGTAEPRLGCASQSGFDGQRRTQPRPSARKRSARFSRSMMRWMMWWITLVSARCIQRATVSSLLPTYDVSAKARCISGSTENGTHLAVEMLKANQPGSLPRICSIEAISRLSSSAPLGSSSAGCSDPALPLLPLPFFFPLLRLLDRGAPTASAGRSASSSTHCSMARGRAQRRRVGNSPQLLFTTCP